MTSPKRLPRTPRPQWITAHLQVDPAPGRRGRGEARRGRAAPPTPSGALTTGGAGIDSPGGGDVQGCDVGAERSASPSWCRTCTCRSKAVPTAY